MDLAVSSLTLLMILLPGFLFVRFFYTKPYYIQELDQSKPALILISVIPGLLIQAVGVQVLSHLTNGTMPRFDYLGYLLSGTQSDDLKKEVFLALRGSMNVILMYYIALCCLSWAIARLMNRAVVYFHLDQRLPSLFRFNTWYYYFTGEILFTREKSFFDMKEIFSQVDMIRVEVMVKPGGDDEPMLYSGILHEFTLSGNEIESIFLLRPIRWKKDAQGHHHPCPMPGDFFLLPGKEIMNLDLTYIQISENK
jgi:hypothetical protein